jgi:hypothetical protein
MAYDGTKQASKAEQKEVFEEALTRFEFAEGVDGANRKESLADIQFAFVPGNQWDPHQKKLRDKRPCYEFNKVRQHIRQVTGDQRQNRPSIKIRAADSNTDPKLADVLTGLVRNIESVSNAERAYDTAFELSTTGGFGVWRVKSCYSDDTAFDQELRIEEVRNPFAVVLDPIAQEWDGRDGRFAFISEFMSKEEFERSHPGKSKLDFEKDLGTRCSQWVNDQGLRVAEYWCRKPVTKTLLLFSTGEVVEKTPEVERVLDELAADGKTVVKERQVDSFEVESYMLFGGGILSGPHPWAGKWIPIVPVWGDRVNIEGKEFYSGMVRFAKDAQRAYNYERTTMMEMVAAAPKSPWLVTKKMVEGLTNVWDRVQSDLLPWLPYNPDPNAPGGRPTREAGPEVPAALLTLAGQSNDDIKAATGQYDASLGQRSNETSGKAIMARQREGDVATFAYIDNLGRAIKFTGEILVDLIPKIYDTERAVRVLGEDGQEEYAVLNQTVVDQQTNTSTVVNDLGKAKFDVAVTVGPSYTTQRMETAEAMLQLSQSNTPDAVIARYLALKSMDIPDSDELLGAMRRSLVAQGMLEPKEGEQAPQPPPPDPEKMAKAAKTAAEAENVEADTKRKQQELAAGDLDDDIKQAELIGRQLENYIKAGQLGIAPDGRLMMMPAQNQPPPVA